MPLISHFYGILISVFSEKDGKHHEPHFHARYAGQEGVFIFDGRMIEGELPRKQRKMIEAWCLMHEEELQAAWYAWNESGEVVKIEGLR